MSEYDPHYDRAAASAILARLAEPGLFAGGSRRSDEALGGSRLVEYTAFAMVSEPGSHLTTAQRLYLEQFMAPCLPEQVVSATHRVEWTDSDGMANTGHFSADGLGPSVPIAARESVLVLWHDLAADQRFARGARDLSDDDYDVLGATTTDREPTEIFRIGIEVVGRTLAQHALVAHHVGIDSGVELARMMESSGLFGAVAASWYWELQATTYRRGMIPVTLQRRNGRLRYTPTTVAMMAEMKRRTIAEAHETMVRAITEEGLMPAEAVAKYDAELDLISKQYALLDPGLHPRCLALSATIGHRKTSVLTEVVSAFVDVFVRMVDLLTIVPVSSPSVSRAGTFVVQQFAVPDMFCRNCRSTIRTVLESHGVQVIDMEPTTKQIRARFASFAMQESAFAAVRSSGYTVVP